MPTVACPRPAHPPPRQRPHRRDARPGPLDPRRHHGPAQGDRRRPRPGRVPLRTEQARHALAPHPARRLRPGRPLLQGREPARRGAPPLLPQGQARCAGHARDRRPLGHPEDDLHSRHRRGGHQPHRLGPPLRPAGRDDPDPRRQPQEADRSGAPADRPHRRAEGRPQEGPGRPRQVGDELPQGRRDPAAGVRDHPAGRRDLRRHGHARRHGRPGRRARHVCRQADRRRQDLTGKVAVRLDPMLTDK